MEIIFSNIILIVVMNALVSPSNSISERLVVLGAGNMIAAFLAKTFWNKSPTITRSENTFSPSDRGLLFIWSICYISSYGLFTYKGGEIEPSLMIIAKSLAPLLAVFLSGHFLKTQTNLKHDLVNLIPAIPLLGICLHILPETTHTSIYTVFIILFLIGSLSINRHLALKFDPAKLAASFCFMNSLLILTASLFFFSADAFILKKVVFQSCFIGIGIVSLQFLYFKGIKSLTPFTSAVCISSLVPFSIFGSSLIGKSAPSIYELLMSISYMVLLAGVSFFKYSSKLDYKSVFKLK